MDEIIGQGPPLALMSGRCSAWSSTSPMWSRSWFREVLAGEDVGQVWSEEDPDADWRIEPGDATEAILASYRAEVDRSRAIVAAASLDDRARRPGREETLRWIA